ncbi:MAG TPA: hypothetical protein VFO52_02710 [Longimicrobiales bacterium]|nr:hypothetical protein [Longimicrobiales bacterium]
MGKFEYLSVLISIIVGLGISHLLSSAARLIQLRRRITLHWPTALWMLFLFIALIQIWWVAFERSTMTDWQFFAFLLYLGIPVSAFILSYLVVPDLTDPTEIDLRASFAENRVWLYGILGAVVLFSFADQAVVDGELPTDADALFRLTGLIYVVLGLVFRSDRAHAVISALILGGFVLYVLRLFLWLA